MDNTRVLIIDDNMDYRRTIVKYLEGHDGITIIGEASDGTEALKMIHEKEIDVILLDIIMPKMDGLYLLEEMKKTSDNLVYKTIIVTALTQESIIKRAVDLGVSFYIAKPFSGKALLSQIQKVTGRLLPYIGDAAQFPGERADEYLHKLLLKVGIPEHRSGFRYLYEAIRLAMDEPDVMNHIMKKLYPEVGKLCDATASNVERAMRNAIELAWNRGEKELGDIFGYKALSMEDKPTNGEFISRIAKEALSKRSLKSCSVPFLSGCII